MTSRFSIRMLVIFSITLVFVFGSFRSSLAQKIPKSGTQNSSCSRTGSYVPSKNPHTLAEVQQQLDKIRLVYFVPGYGTQYKSQDKQIKELKKIYVNARIVPRPWNSFTDWKSAVNNADLFVHELALELKKRPQHELTSVVLVGHSLGGRIVARVLKELGNTRQVNHAVILGGAIDSDESLFQVIGSYDKTSKTPKGGSIYPIFCVCHNIDWVLGESYRRMEGTEAVGLRGPNPQPCAGVWVINIDFPKDQEYLEKVKILHKYFDEVFSAETNEKWSYLDASIKYALEQHSERKSNELCSQQEITDKYDEITLENAKKLKGITDLMGLELAMVDFLPKPMLIDGKEVTIVASPVSISDYFCAGVSGLVFIETHNSLGYIAGFQSAVKNPKLRRH